MFSELDLHAGVPGFGECLRKRPALAQCSREMPCGSVEARHLDAGRAALDQQTDRTSLEIDASKRCIVTAKHAPPDDIDRTVGAQESNRGMRHKADANLIFGREGLKPLEVQRLYVRRVDRPIDRPFEARDIGKIFKRRGGLKTAQERRKVSAIVVQIGGAGRMLHDEQKAAPSKKSLPTSRWTAGYDSRSALVTPVTN